MFALSEHNTCQHGSVVHAGCGHDEAVPDGAAEGGQDAGVFVDFRGSADLVIFYCVAAGALRVAQEPRARGAALRPTGFALISVKLWLRQFEVTA